MDNWELTEEQKRLRAVNTFLLALDGDVDFRPEAILKVRLKSKQTAESKQRGQIRVQTEPQMIQPTKLSNQMDHPVQQVKV